MSCRGNLAKEIHITMMFVLITEHPTTPPVMCGQMRTVPPPLSSSHQAAELRRLTD